LLAGDVNAHHLSAHSFEQVVRRAKARFVLGLSATVTRKDGHHPIIFMQCGPVRHRVDPRAQAAARPARPLGFTRVDQFLDQYWDLVRQREALREFGNDPDRAHIRPASIVEKYEG